jgi:secondary thiamine-phosphate synthase enzyme
MLYRDILTVPVKKGISYIDITNQVEKAVSRSKIPDGLCNIFVDSHSSGIMVNKSDHLLLEDFKNHFKKVEEQKIYAYPNNAFVNIRSSMVSRDVNVPRAKGSLHLSDQKILLWEFGEEGDRNIVITVSF